VQIRLPVENTFLISCLISSRSYQLLLQYDYFNKELLEKFAILKGSVVEVRRSGFTKHSERRRICLLSTFTIPRAQNNKLKLYHRQNTAKENIILFISLINTQCDITTLASSLLENDAY
jgi:hypothetical protein